MTGTRLSLPASVYLLGYDRERGRMRRATWRRYAVGAAALADLWLAGLVAEEDGRLRITGPRPPDDPVLRGLWQRIRDEGPHGWAAWIRRARVDRAVRDQLVADRVLVVERERRLLRPARLGLRDGRAHSRLAGRVAAALRGPAPVASLRPADAALVALLAVGEIRTAVSRDRLRDARRRVVQMAERGGPAVPALHKVIRSAKASVS
jgi:Golgi phosphoprotein 3 (GPP34)